MVDFSTCLYTYLEECKSIIKRFVAIYSRLGQAFSPTIISPILIIFGVEVPPREKLGNTKFFRSRSPRGRVMAI